MSHIEVPDAPLAYGAAVPFSVRPASESLLQRQFGRAVHFLSYHLFLKRRHTVETTAAGFCFTVPPTVFHPATFKTGEYFASFIDSLDLRGLRVADVGTGSGI